MDYLKTFDEINEKYDVKKRIKHWLRQEYRSGQETLKELSKEPYFADTNLRVEADEILTGKVHVSDGYTMAIANRLIKCDDIPDVLRGAELYEKIQAVRLLNF